MPRDLAWLKSRCEQVGDCLLLDHSVQGKGYPQANIDGKHRLVQRYAYTEIYGKRLPKGYVVSATCGNKLCCSKVCLVGVSRGTILTKAYADGKRNQNGELAARRRIAIRNGLNTKLDMEKAKDIRRRRGEGETLQSIADIYGICADTASRVCKQKMWREHINGASVFGWMP